MGVKFRCPHTFDHIVQIDRPLTRSQMKRQTKETEEADLLITMWRRDGSGHRGSIPPRADVMERHRERNRDVVNSRTRKETGDRQTCKSEQMLSEKVRKLLERRPTNRLMIDEIKGQTRDRKSCKKKKTKGIQGWEERDD